MALVLGDFVLVCLAPKMQFRRAWGGACHGLACPLRNTWLYCLQVVLQSLLIPAPWWPSPCRLAAPAPHSADLLHGRPGHGGRQARGPAGAEVGTQGHSMCATSLPLCTEYGWGVEQGQTGRGA